uniref:Charged multivesicular body protein 4b n=1 Tax=Solanum tuberosum TaxID=4113 RepID=M1E0Z0_SOLTU
MLYEQQVDQLENFHLPLLDQMLLLEGANTTTNTIIDVLETAAATREVTLKAPIIEDIDKTIVAVSEHMEIIKMLQEAIFSHICAAADFVKKELSPNEYMLLEVGFVLGAGRILFKLVEKVAVPRSVFWTTKTLQMPTPSILNVLEELDPTIFNALRSKLHKVFNVGTLVPPSSSPKKLFDVNLVGHGYILWFKKQNKGSLLNVALDNEASKELLWVVNTDKEEQDNTVVSLQLYSNLEDKVLIEEGRIVMNITKMEDPCNKMSYYIWDPGKMPIYRRGK